MENIKIYIVTYNNNKALNNTLESLLSSDLTKCRYEINIINNHTNFNLDQKFNFVNVMHNIVRPNFSTGHLARDWNCAIINGFKSLLNPDCDLVITCQNDTNFNYNWFDQLIDWHKDYYFISACPGDGFCSYQVDAIKRVGLWDERFNSIEFQEIDYFNRQKLFNEKWCSINDFHHKRILNPKVPGEYSSTGEFDKTFVWRSNLLDEKIHATSHHNHDMNFALLKSKYDNALDFYNFSNYKNKQTVLYPYFEKDILGLNEKYEMLGFIGEFNA
jgi:hypothetical protein